MNTENKWLKIEPTGESIETWATHSNISETTKENVLQANVLFVPNEGYVEKDILYFPAGTSELFHFVNKNKGDKLKIEACIEDEDYAELSLHADLLTIAGLVVTSLVAPVVVNLISDYIKDRLRARETEETVKATLTVIYEEGKRSLRFSYDGPADKYRDLMLNAISGRSDLLRKQVLRLPQSDRPKQDVKKKRRKKHKR